MIGWCTGQFLHGSTDLQGLGDPSRLFSDGLLSWGPHLMSCRCLHYSSLSLLLCLWSFLCVSAPHSLLLTLCSSASLSLLSYHSATPHSLCLCSCAFGPVSLSLLLTLCLPLYLWFCYLKSCNFRLQLCSHFPLPLRPHFPLPPGSNVEYRRSIR